MSTRGLQDVYELRLLRVHAPRHEPGTGAEGEQARRDRMLDRPLRRGGRTRPLAGRGRVLALGQTIDLIIEEQDLHVHVAPQDVQRVIAADGQAVAVAGDHPHVELGIGELHARGDCRRAAVNGVEAVRRQIIRKARRTADPRDEHRLVGHGADIGERLLHGLENGVVAAARTPAHFLVGRVVLGREARRLDRRNHARIASRIVATLNGLPVTWLSPSTGSKYAARSSCTSWPLFISGTSTRR